MRRGSLTRLPSSGAQIHAVRGCKVRDFGRSRPSGSVRGVAVRLPRCGSDVLRGRHPDAEASVPEEIASSCTHRIGNRSGRSGVAAVVRGAASTKVSISTRSTRRTRCCRCPTTMAGLPHTGTSPASSRTPCPAAAVAAAPPTSLSSKRPTDPRVRCPPTPSRPDRPLPFDYTHEPKKYTTPTRKSRPFGMP